MPAKTNRTGFRAVREATLGAATPPTSGWFKVEVNTPSEAGAQITTTPRTPISEDRARRKGVITDLDSPFAFQQDLTLEALEEFLPAALKADYKHPGGSGVAFFRPTAVVDGGGSEDSFTVAADGDVVNDLLIRARGFTNSGNNGVFKTTGTSTGTAIKVATGTLTAEASPPSNAIVEVCGYEGATGDLEINASGNLISTTVDFTTLGLTVGQFIKIGDTATITQFATAANNDFARITAIAANELTLDKRGGTFATDNGSGKTIRVLFGRFVHDVAVTDSDFLDRSYATEIAFDSLLPGPAAHYEYPIGNTLNETVLEFPLADKAGLSMAFVGTDTQNPTTSRHTGPSTARDALKTEVVNTSSGITRQRVAEIDETGRLTDFTNLTITLNQNVTPQKVHGTLGTSSLNEGNFDVDVSATALFTDATIVNRVRSNTTMGFDAIYETASEGGFAVDIPSATVGEASKGYPVNEPITVESTTSGFRDATLGYQISFSLFPHLP